jgi:hypothetical protein
MTKRRDQQLKAQLSGSSPHWTSGKILIRFLVSGVLVALFVTVAIPALHLITSSNTVEGFARSPDRFGAYTDS